MKQFLGEKLSNYLIKDFLFFENYLSILYRSDIGNTVKLHSDATIVFPIIVAETFAKDPAKSSKI